MDNRELLKYMPDYYNGVYEMEELLKAQGVAVSELDNDIELGLKRNFILKADAKGIAIFENQLGVKPNPEDDLETRRNNVLLHTLPPQPLTIKYLNHLFKIMKLKVEASVNYPERLAIAEAKSEDVDSGRVKNVKYLFNKTLPANMIYQIRITLARSQIKQQIFLGTVTTSDTFLCVAANEGQLNFRTELTSDLYIGAGTNTLVEANVEANVNQIKE